MKAIWYLLPSEFGAEMKMQRNVFVRHIFVGWVATFKLEFLHVLFFTNPSLLTYC